MNNTNNPTGRDPRASAAAASESRDLDPIGASASERLMLSRERLRTALQESSSGRRKKRAPSADGDQHGFSAMFAGLSAIPGVGVLVDGVRGWWAHHPMRLATLVATDAARTFVRPMAKANPFGLVLGALAFGVVIAWAKPWRGLLKPALFAGLLPQIISRAMTQVPLESWISALMAMATKQPAPKSTKAAAAGTAANGPAKSTDASSATGQGTDAPGGDRRPPNSPVH